MQTNPKPDSTVLQAILVVEVLVWGLNFLVNKTLRDDLNFQNFHEKYHSGYWLQSYFKAKKHLKNKIFLMLEASA